MKPVKSSDFKEAIIFTKIIDDTLLVVDATTTIRYLNIKTLEIKGGFKANITHKRYSSKVIDFSSKADYFVSMSADCKESKLYNSKTKKSITKVDRHHGEVSCVGIDPKDRYMFSCGDDGKVFVVDIKSGKLIFTLPYHIDTVNDIVFSSDAQWLATASYDKNISIFNLSIMRQQYKLRAHSSPVMKLHFLSNHRLFSVDKNSSAIIWDLESGKVIERLKDIHDDVTQVTICKDSRFLFLGTKLGYIIVYDLNSYESISMKYIKLTHSISSLAFDNSANHLIIGGDNGTLLFYDIYEGESSLNEFIRQKRYDLVEKYAEENPMLRYTKPYQILNSLWERTVEKAKEYLGVNDKIRASKLFENFKSIPSKNQFMQKLIKEFDEFEKFTLLAKQGKIALAYLLANKHPLYKDTDIYKSMELNWKKTFAIAQKYILDPKRTEQAREILAPYRGISEKTKNIQEMLSNAQVIKRFKDSIIQKEFKLAYELIKLHEFLKETSDYDKLSKYADTLYIRSQKFIEDEDTHSAIKLLRVLVEFADFTEEAKTIMRDIENGNKFFNAVKDEDIILAYNLLDTTQELQETPDGKRLQNLWENDLAIANSYALEGDVDGIKRVLEQYLKITSKNISLASLLGWCYITQLENSLNDNLDQTKLERGIKNYILYFGLTGQISMFFERFQEKYTQSKLNLESQTEGSINNWRPSMMVKSILD